MKTGIFGGTFDPIHIGHTEAAILAVERLELDRVLLLPSGEPPYKRCHASREDRLRMVEIACAGHPKLVPCDVEIARPGRTYTADTLRTLKTQYPDDTFVYLIGSDALEALGQWRDAEALAALTTFAVIGRPGWNRAAAEAKAAALRAQFGLSVALTDIEGLNVSSGMVRDRVAAGEDISDIAPQGVGKYIREHGLYLCAYTEPELLEKLQKALTVHRYHHTLAVAETAERLAARFGVDPHRARLAGLLHDCAKSLPYGELRRLTSECVSDTDELELDAEPVLHAPAGMVVAKRDYGARDPVILQAIRRHTIGGPNMTAMDALIYVADFIEPGRRPFPGLEQVRALAETDLFAAMRLSAQLSNNFLISRGKQPHPKSIALTGGEPQ